MNRLAPLLLTVLIAGTAAGCPSTPVTPSAPLSQPQRSSIASGDFVHEPSGVSFPEQIGDFTRGSLTVYDEEGLDISVGYNLPGQVTATLYVYPGPQISVVDVMPGGPPPDILNVAFEQHAQQMIDRIKANIPGVRFLKADAYPLPKSADSVYHGVLAEFSRGGSGRMNALLVLHDRRWYVKYYLSSERSDAETMNDWTQTLVSVIP